jgi:hypothetical protein
MLEGLWAVPAAFKPVTARVRVQSKQSSRSDKTACDRLSKIAANSNRDSFGNSLSER